MDAKTFKGNWHDFKGECQKRWGQLTDDDLLECDGDYDKFLGIVQRRYRDKENDVQSWTNDWYSEREQAEIRRRHATVSRNQA